MFGIKDQVDKVVSNALLNKARVAAGLEPEKVSYHMLLTGNPGTGKTTITDKMGQLFYELGVVDKPGVVHLNRSQLTGPFANTAAASTAELIAKNKGKVIFIDEAYALYNGPQDLEGRQVVDELMRQAEENRDGTVIVLAGYNEEMRRMFDVNPGFKSRFPRHIDLPDYTPQEKGLVLEYQMAEKGNSFESGTAAKAARDYVAVLPSGGEKGNARAVRNFHDRMIEMRSRRLLEEIGDGRKLDRSHFLTFTSGDVKAAADQVGLIPQRRMRAAKKAAPARAGHAKRTAPRRASVRSAQEVPDVVATA